MGSPTKKSKKTRSKLGRGLSALVDQTAGTAVQVSPIKPEQNTNTIAVGDKLASVPAERSDGSLQRVLEIDVTTVVPNPHQPRRDFEEESLEDLAQSIAEHGLMQPIVVRNAQEGRYELIAGERRWRATCRTGQLMIRAIVLDVDDAKSAELALIENIQREDLNPIERAHGFATLGKRFSMTQEQISRRVGISRSSVANILRLIELEDEIQLMIASGSLGTGHGKALLSCKDPDRRMDLARQAVQQEWTVRILEKKASANIGSYLEQDNLDTSPTNQELGGGISRIGSVLMDLEKRLGEQLGTEVKLKTDRSGKKGLISIAFYDLDHFDGLMTRLGVGEADELGVD